MILRCWLKIVALISFISLTLGAAPATLGAALPAAPGYSITDLGSLGGGQTVPVAINASGDVAGYSTTTAGEIHAFLLPNAGPMQDLGLLGGTSSFATGLNNRGDVVGYSAAAGPTRPFILLDGQWSGPEVASNVVSRALAINDLRQVLLVSDDGAGRMSTALWQNGRAQPLDVLAGGSVAGNDLNQLGEVVGNAPNAAGVAHGFALDSFLHRLIDLGEIGPKGTVTHLNELGQAIGTRITNRGNRIAFGADLSKQSDLIEDKIVRRGFGGTAAFWINNESTTVGLGDLSNGAGTNAGMWTADGQFLNVNTALLANSGWTLQTATAINDAGVIVGRALAPDGQLIAYMLMAIGPLLPGTKALALAPGLDEAIATVEKGAAAAAAAATPTAIATALVDLRRTRLLLTPAAGQTTISEVRTAQVTHLLNSAVALLGIPDSTLFLPASERDRVLDLLAAAQKVLQ